VTNGAADPSELLVIAVTPRESHGGSMDDLDADREAHLVMLPSGVLVVRSCDEDAGATRTPTPNTTP
jgi:hypothetical protein